MPTTFLPIKGRGDKAQRIVEAMEQAAKEGKGAVSLDGRLIDIASIRMAESVLAKAKSVLKTSGFLSYISVFCERVES